MCVGFVLRARGAYREAAAAYEKASELGYRAAPHAARVIALRVEPEWDNLRSNPRFVAIARKTGVKP